LVEAERWHTGQAEHLTPAERGFIQASLALREQERQAEEERRQRELAQPQAAEQQKRAEAEGLLRVAEQEKRVETERRSRRRLSFLSTALLVVFLGAIWAAKWPVATSPPGRGASAGARAETPGRR
jgi:hypothetical protein